MNKKIIRITLPCILIDQISKLIALNFLKYQTPLVVVPNFFYLTLVKNEGASFSILSGQIPFLIIISFIALFLILAYLNQRKDMNKKEIFCYSMVLGGLIGNLIDRVFRNGVIDFLSFEIFKMNFPIFNIADTFIVCGIFILIFLEFRGGKSDFK